MHFLKFICLIINHLKIFLVIIPHLGSAATETREEMAVMTAKNILAVLHNQPEKMPAAFQL